MWVEAIDDIAAFRASRPAWEALYARDPDGQIFLSHRWLETWFTFAKPRWLVLTARPARGSGDPLGFFPLRLRRPARPGAAPTLVPAGASLADYTGFLCAPEAEAEVARAFGQALPRLGLRADLDNLLLSERRFASFTRAAAATGARVTDRPGTDNHDGIDLSTAPRAALPGDWETFLETRMSANSRQKARRFLRRLDGDPALSVRSATGASLGRDLGILMALWETAWASRKGDNLARVARTIRQGVAAFHAAGLLDLRLLWRDGTPLAAHALYVDPVRRALYFSVGACDKTARSPPPSFLLHCEALRRAIAEGYRCYDFMRGDEAYKFSFCDDSRRLRHVSLGIAARAGGHSSPGGPGAGPMPPACPEASPEDVAPPGGP